MGRSSDQGSDYCYETQLATVVTTVQNVDGVKTVPGVHVVPAVIVLPPGMPSSVTLFSVMVPDAEV